MGDTQQMLNALFQAYLAEYATLRAEILQRSTMQIQICTVSGTATVAVLGFVATVKSAALALLLIPVIALLLFLGLRFVDYDTRAAASRIVEIERAVNDIAGKQVLIWETQRGLLAKGYARRWLYVLGIGHRRKMLSRKAEV